ncbi:hypothetical protein POSPLADRAFT_1030720 [Postia placenta MAD-698-R-SB12]|uniref:Uncharacterized protein n=1 Tax=Postia placenta MAD-698-R-SB12 TaxID=670580 RepID=A0A1X6NHH1_9APHY|nr:hypothetical protein POSPLADRAFT_1030720 [Postia placenta MAD-698-R-SB12]OSX67813.1 hypothetical protein POSPLADRAFT_1030720 [Postia placenta MAD-698-R-SB12]
MPPPSITPSFAIMNTLPSPPLRAVPSDSARHSHNRRTQRPDSPMDTLLGAVWQSIQQSPPPSLRDILDAYRAKGDGDRDMLIAMLNAKSAEDQRIASLASLQRTMLDMYQPALHPSSHSIPPLHLSTDVHSHSHYGHHHSPSGPSYSVTHMPSPPHTSYHHSPHSRVHAHDESAYMSHRRGSSASASSPTAKEALLAPSGSSPTRKRRRSRSPPPAREHQRMHLEQLPGSAHDLPLPPSPYSSASSHSSGGSPRSRESMAIGQGEAASSAYLPGAVYRNVAILGLSVYSALVDSAKQPARRGSISRQM